MKKILLAFAAFFAFQMPAFAAKQLGGTLAKHPDVLIMDPISLGIALGTPDWKTANAIYNSLYPFNQFLNMVTTLNAYSYDTIFFATARTWLPLVNAVYSKNANPNQDETAANTQRFHKLMIARKKDLADKDIRTWFVPVSDATLNMPDFKRAEDGSYFLSIKAARRQCVTSSETRMPWGRVGNNSLCLRFSTVTCKGMSPEDCEQRMYRAGTSLDDTHGIHARVRDRKMFSQKDARTDAPPKDLLFGYFVEPTAIVDDEGQGRRTRNVLLRRAAIVEGLTGKVLCEFPMNLEYVQQTQTNVGGWQVPTICEGDM